VVRLSEGVSTEKNMPGRRFRAELEAPLEVEGRLLAPAGSEAWGELTEVDERMMEESRRDGRASP
jgi:hypothetical protein